MLLIGFCKHINSWKAKQTNKLTFYHQGRGYCFLTYSILIYLALIPSKPNVYLVQLKNINIGSHYSISDPFRLQFWIEALQKLFSIYLWPSKLWVTQCVYRFLTCHNNSVAARESYLEGVHSYGIPYPSGERGVRGLSPEMFSKIRYNFMSFKVIFLPNL